MNIVRAKPTLKKCLAVLAACFALNLIAPLVIAQQRTIHPGQSTTVTFDGPADLEHQVITAKAAKSGEVDIRGKITLDGVSYTDEYTANATSAYPARGRDELSFVFPYRPERRSYPFIDPLAPYSPSRLDYVSPGSVGGLDTYKYRADISGSDYTAQRIVDLEVRTGAILDETWAVTQGPVEGLFRMSETSRGAAREEAAAKVAVLRGLQVLAWLTRFVAVIALVWAAVTIARR